MEDKHEPLIENDVETPQNAPQQATEHSGEESKALTLYDQMAKTWKLDIKDLIPLINVPPGQSVTASMAEMVRAASMQYGIPIPGFDLIPDGKGRYKLYINASGVQFRLATDPRELESVIPTIEHMPEPGEPKENDYIMVKATIKMRNGAVAEDFGISEWPASGKDSQMRKGDLIMKLTTKAIRRASTRLVGTTLPVGDEDYYAFVSGPGRQVIEGEWKEVEPPKPDKPTNLPQLLTMALEVNKELNATKLTEMMGVNAITELNIDKTWEKIKNDYGTSREA